MSRLFITPRELNFISDITKEIIKDVNGQVIYYYSISEFKTKTHLLYNEAIEKIFDNPIAIDALVSAQFQQETKIGIFGPDQQFQLEVFIQYRDLVDKGIDVAIGDFFSFGEIFYEIADINTLQNIFGQAEHKDGIKVTGVKVRSSQFKAKLLGPTDISYTDADAIQTKFVQQRGQAENSEGATGDKRELIEQGVLERPLTGAKEVSPTGAIADNSRYESAFYDDEE